MVKGDTMTIKEAVNAASSKLKNHAGTPALDAYVIMGSVTGKERWYLISHEDETLPEETLKEYFLLIDKRLGGMPVQYITGCQEFMSLNFFVNKSVLVPRPDTEILVEEAIKHISALPEGRKIKVLDIGTGSGCIAISIAKYTKEVEVTAVDISMDALAAAERNAVFLGVKDKVEFICSDLFEKVDKSFDVIVSNPPYIPSALIGGLQTEVRVYEPHQALDGGEDGLDYYRRLVQEGFAHLNPGGVMMFEIGYDQAVDIRQIINEFEGYNNFAVIRDLAGLDRVVTISRKI